MIFKNTLANYFGQFYVIAIGIIVTPFFLEYLGPEQYGLVAFYAILQAWMGFLDVAISPVVGREIAFSRGLGSGYEVFGTLLSSLEAIFFVFAVVFIFIVLISAPYVGENWFNLTDVSESTVVYSLKIMGIIIATRWFVSLYKSGLTGLQEQVLLNTLNVLFQSIKFVGGLTILMFWSQDIRIFFGYQILVSAFEVIAVAYFFYNRLKPFGVAFKIRLPHWASIKRIIPFALSLGYGGIVWVLITQTDKLIMSNKLSLADFGYFSLIGLIANGVLLLAGPISTAFTPRMTELFANSEINAMVSLYRKGTQAVMLLTLITALMMGVYGKELVYAWTGDNQAALWGQQLLIWLALGNCILAISAFQFYLQTAFGDLKLHVVGATISLFIQLPTLYLSAIHYGPHGVVVAWFVTRLIWFLIWTPVIHRKLIPGFHLKWIISDILPIVVFGFAILFMIKYLYSPDISNSRIRIIGELILLGSLGLLLCSLSLKSIRNFIYKFILKFARNFKIFST